MNEEMTLMFAVIGMIAMAIFIYVGITNGIPSLCRLIGKWIQEGKDSVKKRTKQ